MQANTLPIHLNRGLAQSNPFIIDPAYIPNSSVVLTHKNMFLVISSCVCHVKGEFGMDKNVEKISLINFMYNCTYKTNP